MLAAMCGPPPPPPISVVPLPNLNSLGMETSAAFSPTVTGPTGHPGTMIVERNNRISGGGNNAWDFSTNAGATWTPCDVNKASCGNTPTGVPFAQGLKKLVYDPLTNLFVLTTFSQQSWDGDPQVAASRDGRTVVMANLARSFHISDPNDQSSNPDSVVVTSSIDGGQHFIVTEFVDPITCHGYFEDQESLTADPTFPNRYWIVWRDRPTELNYFGGCFRGFDVRPDGSFSFLAPEAPFPTTHPIDASVGGMIVQAFGDEITVVYSNTNKAATVGCDGTYGVEWLAVTSLDRGSSWNTPRSIHYSPTQWTCLPSSVGRVQTGMRNFAFVRSPTTRRMFVALPEDDNLGFRVFHCDDSGFDWETDFHFGVDGQFTFFPNFAVDDHGRLGASFQAIGTSIRGAPIVATWFGSGTTAIPISGDYLPVATGGPDGTRSLGDYAGLATIPSGEFGVFSGVNATFFPVWTATDGLSSRVRAALVTLSP